MTKRCRRGGDKGKSIYLRLDDLRLKFVLLNNCSLAGGFMIVRVTPTVNRQIVNRSNLIVYRSISIPLPTGEGDREKPTL